MCCRGTSQFVRPPEEYRQDWNCAPNRNEVSALESFQSVWRVSLIRTELTRICWPLWQQSWCTRPYESARKIWWVQWWSRQASKSQQKVPCEHQHNRPSNDAATSSADAVPCVQFRPYRRPTLVDWDFATWRRVWQRKSVSIQWCRETGTAKRPARDYRECLSVDIRRCCEGPWVLLQPSYGCELPPVPRRHAYFLHKLHEITRMNGEKSAEQKVTMTKRARENPPTVELGNDLWGNESNKNGNFKSFNGI